MTYHGIVRNGVVVLDDGASLPEGVSVKIQTAPLEPSPVDMDDIDLFDFGKLAVDTGIPDLAINHDHYLYGHPKVSDDQ